MVAAAVVGAVATVGGAAVNASATKKATKAAQKAADKNAAAIGQTQTENNALFKPFIEGGTKANALSNDFLGVNGFGPQTTAKQSFNAFKDASGFNFDLRNGADALNSNAATRGLLKSGSALKGLTDYQTNLADKYATTWLNGLGQQSANGLNAASGNANSNSAMLGATTGNNNALATTTGNAALAGASNISNLLSQGANLFAATQGFGARNGSSYGGSSTMNDWANQAARGGWS